MPNDVKQLTLEEAATHLLEECRMVLPGIQALFGFQLVVVFSPRFDDALSASERIVHLVAILCVVAAVALVMAPAALHRRREPESVSRRFIEISSRLLMWSMAPLAAGTTLDVYLVARVIMRSATSAAVTAAVTSATFGILWLVLPLRVRLETGSTAP
jgi:uncharacterized membrane protein